MLKKNKQTNSPTPQKCHFVSDIKNELSEKIERTQTIYINSWNAVRKVWTEKRPNGFRIWSASDRVSLSPSRPVSSVHSTTTVVHNTSTFAGDQSQPIVISDTPSPAVSIITIHSDSEDEDDRKFPAAWWARTLTLNSGSEKINLKYSFTPLLFCPAALVRVRGRTWSAAWRCTTPTTLTLLPAARWALKTAPSLPSLWPSSCPQWRASRGRAQPTKLRQLQVL